MTNGTATRPAASTIVALILGAATLVSSTLAITNAGAIRDNRDLDRRLGLVESRLAVVESQLADIKLSQGKILDKLDSTR